MLLASATRVGPYEIVSTLGEGSMGEVYVAKDLRLSRNVALKTINAQGANDAARQRRFLQEARASSSLNHPNIVTIHDFGTSDGISYIVSELIDGESLRKVVQRGPMPIRQLLDVAVQIADGLAAAHQAGIVHRDLKPENILITPGGRVKILDFGLAKAVLPENPTEDSLIRRTLDGEDRTEPGLILGTVGYMSPEQARGLEVSFPSDQFSLGVILHEMATGVQPFRRETPMQTLLAIASLERVPFTPGPVGFRLLVERCLAKDPARRFPSTSDIYDRLRKIRDELPETPTPVQKTTSEIRSVIWRFRVRRQIAVPVLGGVLLFLTGVLAARLLWRAQPYDASSLRFTPLSSSSGLQLFPAMAPNRDAVTYSAEWNGVLQIFTRKLGSLLETQLTRGDRDCLFPFWTPDSTRVYYTSDGNLWSVGATGGSPQMEYPHVVHAAISPDGGTLALIRDEKGNGSAYGVWSSTNGGPLEQVSSSVLGSRFAAQSFAAFSRDGKKLGLWATTLSGTNEFWIIPWPNGKPYRALTGHPVRALGQMFSWMPNGTQIVYSDHGPGSSAQHLWLANINNGSRRQLTNGVLHESAPAVSAQSDTIAFQSVLEAYSLAQVGLNGAGATDFAPALSTLLPSANKSAPLGVLSHSASNASPSFSPQHHEFAYVTGQFGLPEIWLRSTTSDWQRRLVTSSDFPGAAVTLDDVNFSPDGQRIAFRRADDHAETIWISTSTGESPVRLLRSATSDYQRWPTWSPDGNWIAYNSLWNGHSALMKARVGGRGGPALVHSDAGTHPAWSPSANWIATLAPREGVFLTSPDGHQSRRVGTGCWRAIAWTANGSRLVGIVESKNGRLVLASLDPSTGQEQVTADLGLRPTAFAYGDAIGLDPIRGASISMDGKVLLTSILGAQSDLWLLSGFER